MKSYFFLSILIFVNFLFSNAITNCNSYWQRNDGSIYKFIDNYALLEEVGYELTLGKFSPNDTIIKDIYETEKGTFGFRKINNQEGIIVKWEKIQLIIKPNNILEITDLSGNLITTFHNSSGDKITQPGITSWLTGYWQRDDGSIYYFEENKAILKRVGYNLSRGYFKLNDTKIKDIYVKSNSVYGLRRINNSEGKLLRWEKIKIAINEAGSMRIINSFNKILATLTKISENEFEQIMTLPDEIIGKWKREDGSIYNFEGEVAIITRLGYKLEEFKFKENQVKIKEIRNIYNGYFEAYDRINNEYGKLSKWNNIKIQLTPDKLIFYSLSNEIIQSFDKFDERDENSELISKLLNKNYQDTSMVQTRKSLLEQKEIDISSVTNTQYISSELEKNIPTIFNTRKYGIAVIIGNSEYELVGNVKFAEKDAELMKQYLIKTLGYNEEDIIFEPNASKARFETIFGTAENYHGKLYNWLKQGESDVFIYYAGHGAPDIKNNKAYFVPVDSDPSTISLNGYSIDTFYKNLAKLPYKNLTVVIDACFSGRTQSGLLINNISPAGIEVDDPIIELPNSSIFLSSSGTEYSSWYEEKGHSLFTYYFLKGIKGEADKDKDKILTTGELMQYINEEVPYKARRLNSIEQNPQFSGDEDRIFIKY